jgi:hypothetical protein
VTRLPSDDEWAHLTPERQWALLEQERQWGDRHRLVIGVVVGVGLTALMVLFLLALGSILR